MCSAADGVFDGDGRFVADEPPDDDDVMGLLVRAGRGVLRLLRRFYGDDSDRQREVDGLFAALDKSSAQPAPALFPAPPARRTPLSAFADGFSLHGATRVLASDRRGLWRLCAYGARGAIALSRLRRLDDGRFVYDMKRSLPDGRSQLVMTGVELLKKLVPLVPPARANLTRFHGVFAPRSRLRALVVPTPPASPAPLDVKPAESAPTPAPKPALARPAYRLDWAALLKRVHSVDVMVCSMCQGPMKVIAFLEDPAVVKSILTHLRLPKEPLPIARSRGPPLELL